LSRPAKAIGDDGVDNVQAKTDATQITARREEGIEGLGPNVMAHTKRKFRRAGLDSQRAVGRKSADQIRNVVA
jgi:hypothetical protein